MDEGTNEQDEGEQEAAALYAVLMVFGILVSYHLEYVTVGFLHQQ